jgi:hypothetical protein
MTKIKFLLLIAMTLLFSGCALTNHVIEQPYQPTLNKIEGAEKYSVFTKVNFQPVFQNDPKAIGVKKNGYGNETARIYLSENVEDWLKKGFDQELKAAGFDVVNSQNNNAVKITLNVRQIFVEPWVGFWSADVYGIFKIEAKLELPNKDSYYIRKFVTYDKSTNLVWTDGVLESKIINAAQKSISEIVREICLLFTRNI